MSFNKWFIGIIIQVESDVSNPNEFIFKITT